MRHFETTQGISRLCIQDTVEVSTDTRIRYNRSLSPNTSRSDGGAQDGRDR